MDYDLRLRIIQQTKWQFFDNVVCKFRVRRGAQSADKDNAVANRSNLEIVLKRHLNFFEYRIAKVTNLLIDMINTVYR
jgi:hypothetical protein